MNIKRVTACIVLSMTMSASIVFADDRTASEPDVSVSSPPPLEFSPMTRYERLGNYAARLVSIENVFTSAATAGISQANNTPKEWGGGAEAFGERFGNSFAQHVIRGTLEYGISAALHEDNRYFVSGQNGFLRRTKYAVMSTLLARRDNGSRTFSFSRIGSTAGAAFISREWQPPSTTTAGDGAVTFGITMASQIGFNVVREFLPDLKRHFHKGENR
jgi:hypothetical protein